MAKPNKKTPTGNQPPPDDDDGDQGGGDDELTDGQISRITNIVNAAVSGQLSRKLTAAIETAITPLREALETRGARGQGGEGDDEDDDPPQQRGKNGKQRATKDPEVEQLRNTVKKMEEERKKEQTEARNGKRDSLLREQLEAAGVDKNRIRGAVAVMRDSMKYDEKAGEWVYKAKRDGYEEDVDVSTGVSEWAGTDEGKSYLAPPQQQQQQRGGSGVRPTGGNGGAPRLQNGGRPQVDPKAAKVQAKQDALQNLTKAIDSLGGGNIPLG